jgi:hypothetical protein
MLSSTLPKVCIKDCQSDRRDRRNGAERLRRGLGVLKILRSSKIVRVTGETGAAASLRAPAPRGKKTT